MRQLDHRFLAVLATGVLVALTLALLAAARTAQGVAAVPTTIRVKAIEFRFVLSAKSAPRGRVTFVVKNIGYSAHDFKIDGRRTPLIDAAATARLTVVFTKAGKYPYRCTVDGHALAGMKGVFTVR